MAIRSAAVITLALALVACGGTPRDAGPPKELPFPLSIQAAVVPAQGESGQSQVTSSPRGAILSWLERDGAAATLKFAEYASGRWSDARTIASSDRWFVSEADTPTVMRMSDGTLVATIAPLIDFRLEAYDLRLMHSRDDGKTWSAPISPYRDTTKTQHGFAALVELPDRALGVVWLDGRDQELNPADEQRASMDVRFATFDRNWKQTSESAIDQRVCQCCQVAAAMSADGPVVAFRDRSDKEIRDIHVTRLAGNTWSDASPVHADNWQIDACPVNGPALSARDRTVAVAWFTAPEDDGHAYAAFSQDSGRTWTNPIRLDDGTSLGQVDIELLEDGSAVAMWLEYANERNQVRARQVKPSGERSASVILAGEGEARVSGYPHVARLGSELVFAWSETEEGPQRLKAAVGTLKK